MNDLTPVILSVPLVTLFSELVYRRKLIQALFLNMIFTYLIHHYFDLLNLVVIFMLCNLLFYVMLFASYGTKPRFQKPPGSGPYD